MTIHGHWAQVLSPVSCTHPDNRVLSLGQNRFIASHVEIPRWPMSWPPAARRGDVMRDSPTLPQDSVGFSHSQVSPRVPASLFSWNLPQVRKWPPTSGSPHFARRARQNGMRVTTGLWAMNWDEKGQYLPLRSVFQMHNPLF